MALAEGGFLELVGDFHSAVEEEAVDSDSEEEVEGLDLEVVEGWVRVHGQHLCEVYHESEPSAVFLPPLGSVSSLVPLLPARILSAFSRTSFPAGME